MKFFITAACILSVLLVCSCSKERPESEGTGLSLFSQKEIIAAHETEKSMPADPVQKAAFSYAEALFSGNCHDYIQQFKLEVQLSHKQRQLIHNSDLYRDFKLYIESLNKISQNAGGIVSVFTALPHYDPTRKNAVVDIQVSFKDERKEPYKDRVRMKRYGSEWLPQFLQ